MGKFVWAFLLVFICARHRTRALKAMSLLQVKWSPGI